MATSIEHQALLTILNRPLLPELSINLIDALAQTFSLKRRLDPQLTAQQFLNHALELAALEILYNCRRQLHARPPTHHHGQRAVDR